MFQEIRPGAGFETSDFVQEKLGGGYRTTTLVIKTHFLNAHRNDNFATFFFFFPF